MKTIELTQGKKAIIDDDDYPYLSRFRWVLANGHVYMEVGGSGVMMANFIKDKGKSLRYVFKNRDTLDLRKANIATVPWGVVSGYAKKTSKITSSKYKGVYKDKRDGKWYAYITIRKNGKRIKVLWQPFEKEDDAARARNKKALEVFGPLAYQNIIE